MSPSSCLRCNARKPRLRRARAAPQLSRAEAKSLILKRLTGRASAAPERARRIANSLILKRPSRASAYPLTT